MKRISIYPMTNNLTLIITKKSSNFTLLQLTPDNSNLQGKSKRVRLIVCSKQIMTGNKEISKQDGEGMQVSWTWTDKLKSENKEYTVVLQKKFSVLECITDTVFFPGLVKS